MIPIVRLFFRFYSWVLSPIAHAIAGSHAGCRFRPTCSQYAEESMSRLGIFRGSLLALRQVSKCHPWSSRS